MEFNCVEKNKSLVCCFPWDFIDDGWSIYRRQRHSASRWASVYFAVLYGCLSPVYYITNRKLFGAPVISSQHPGPQRFLCIILYLSSAVSAYFLNCVSRKEKNILTTSFMRFTFYFQIYKYQKYCCIIKKMYTWSLRAYVGRGKSQCKE